MEIELVGDIARMVALAQAPDTPKAALFEGGLVSAFENVGCGDRI